MARRPRRPSRPDADALSANPGRAGPSSPRASRSKATNEAGVRLGEQLDPGFGRMYPLETRHRNPVPRSGDHHLSVEHATLGHICRRIASTNSGKYRVERLLIAAPQHDVVPVPEHDAAESVPLRLVDQTVPPRGVTGTAWPAWGTPAGPREVPPVNGTRAGPMGGCPPSGCVALGPSQEVINRKGVHDPIQRDADLGRPARTRAVATRAGRVHGHRCPRPPHSRATSAREQQCFRRVERSGLELISTAVPVAGTRREDGLGVKGRRRPPRPARIRPVQ